MCAMHRSIGREFCTGGAGAWWAVLVGGAGVCCCMYVCYEAGSASYAS